jgi:cytoskeletal protein CcmA (bactofilin family)
MVMKRLAVLLAALWLLLVPLPVLAFTPRAGDAVVVTETITDDLYAAGGTVEISGTLDGDVAAVGGSITVSGPVSGSVLAGGGSVSISGAVGRNVRAGAGTLMLGGRVATDALLAGGKVSVQREAEIGRDLLATGGNVRFSGAVGRNAFFSGGTILIAGRIEGDATVEADRLRVLSSARIGGRLRYRVSRPVEIQEGSQITGGAEQMPRRVRPRSMLRSFPYMLAWRVTETLWLLVLGLVLLVVAPRAVARVSERIHRGFGYSLLTGFILVVVIPVAAVIVALTFVGVPLAIVLMLLYGATLIAAQVFPAAWLGRWLLGRVARAGAEPSPYLAQIVGTLLMVLLIALPFLGWLVRLVAVLLGVGSLWAGIWATRQRPAPAT